MFWNKRKFQLKIRRECSHATLHNLQCNGFACVFAALFLRYFCSFEFAIRILFFSSRKLIPSAAAAAAVDRDSECAGIRIAAKIPIGICFSNRSANSTVHTQIKLIQIYYVRSRKSKRSSTRTSHVSVARSPCALLRHTPHHQQQLESGTQVKRNEKCNFEWGDKILAKIFR